MEYQFSADAFSGNASVFNRILSKVGPCKKILEIGSYEGRSAVWFIENILIPRGDGELYCIDPWHQEGQEDPAFWKQVEKCFDTNISLAIKSSSAIIVHKRKGKSIFHLSKLVAEGHRDSFDFIYVDGNHQAAEVLSDIVLAFELLRNDGLMVCDDYLWRVNDNPVHSPKMAIDAFGNIYFDKVFQLKHEPNYQAYFIKRHGRLDKQWSREIMSYVWPPAVTTRDYGTLQQTIVELRHEIEAIRRSSSWRVTTPLRFIANKLRRR